MGCFNDTDLLRKGIYPYDFMDTMDKFNVEELPSKECFFNSLTNKSISDKEYEFAQEIWSKYNCKSMKDYHNVYLSTDVLLLADIVENFRTLCLNVYKLDPCHFVSDLLFPSMQC